MDIGAIERVVDIQPVSLPLPETLAGVELTEATSPEPVGRGILEPTRR